MENEQKKMQIRVKITNEETGQIFYDEVGEGILGAFYNGDGKTTGIINGAFSNRTVFEIMLALRSVEDAMEKRHPGLKRFLAVADVLELNKMHETTEVDLSELLKTE